MKFAPWIILTAFMLLAGLTFVPAPVETIARARVDFSSEEIERGIQFATERRLLFWGETLAELGLLLALVFGGGAARVTGWCHRLVGGRWLPTVMLVGAVCYLALAIVAFPFAAGRWQLLTIWNMTSRSFGDWFVEHLLGLGVTAAVEAIVLVGLYLLLRRHPRGWWLAAALGATLLAAVFAWLLPIVISPLFNTFTPLGETRWAAWEGSLRRLVEQAGVPVDEILVMDASRQSRHSNAYFTGFGGTRRIVLFDNLLANHTLPEVESVLAHELGHWLHDHIVQGIALGGLAALAGLFIMSRLLLWARGALNLESPSDPAGLPFIILLMLLGHWLTMPMASAVSRRFERQADRVALELAQRPEAFIAAEIKLVRDNIGNPAPAPWNVWLFATHPPAVERIETAQAWQRDSR
jgi:STE24 endopeptidase